VGATGDKVVEEAAPAPSIPRHPGQKGGVDQAWRSSQDMLDYLQTD
jgi:hypothetical protein